MFSQPNLSDLSQHIKGMKSVHVPVHTVAWYVCRSCVQNSSSTYAFSSLNDQRSLGPCRDLITTFFPGSYGGYLVHKDVWLHVTTKEIWHECLLFTLGMIWKSCQCSRNLDWVWNHIIFPIVIIGKKKKKNHLTITSG